MVESIIQPPANCGEQCCVGEERQGISTVTSSIVFLSTRNARLRPTLKRYRVGRVLLVSLICCHRREQVATLEDAYTRKRRGVGDASSASMSSCRWGLLCCRVRYAEASGWRRDTRGRNEMEGGGRKFFHAAFLPSAPSIDEAVRNDMSYSRVMFLSSRACVGPGTIQ